MVAMSLNLSEKMLNQENFTLGEKTSIVAKLSMPGILAQISDIIMQYIDAAMVGALGAAASASIGLVASSTWLMGGLLGACASGFSVQVAHASGAGDKNRASSVFRQSIAASLLFSFIIMAIGLVLSGYLPRALGADQSLWKDATAYMACFCLFIPVRQINRLSANMLQCSGDMKTPSILMTLMCLLDVVFNYFLIFPSRSVSIGSFELWMPGAGLGVLGAQLGTSLSVLVCAVLQMYAAAYRSEMIRFANSHDGWIVKKDVLKKACSIGIPMALESSALSMAQIVSTRIIAPLGTAAIAAHSFAITAESICYMPGYGIGSAATTLVGQAIGAERKDLARSFGWLSVAAGMAVMTLTGAAMYVFCPYVFAFLTPSFEVQQLGARVLRYELLAEPLFAASIVATGALRGAGDTLIPGILNLVSMWGIRLTLAWFLSRSMGLDGVWIAMAIELSCRGILFLIRLKREKWLNTEGRVEK